jgi:DNA-binding NtrC family response regulator
LPHPDVLLVDDDPVIRFAIRSFLEARGTRVRESGTCTEARSQLQNSPPDAAVVDMSLPDGDGLMVLRQIQEHDSEIPLVILTGQGSIELAVRAMSQGARNFLTKPVELAALDAILRRELQNRRHRQRSLAANSRNRREPPNPFLGSSPAIRRLREVAEKVADTDCPILVLGETGSGKGVLAHWIHANSPRGKEEFLDLNCAGLDREFLETELFGHQKGAFTGAVIEKPGLLEVANGGTVFLDEIGDVDLPVQPKLLKVLETGRFRRLGDIHDRVTDVRLISATHRNLPKLIQEGLFREDLYYRINIIPIVVPPLRSRVEDIPVLAHHFLTHMAHERGLGEVALDGSATDALQNYSWPGNIRELRNVLERALLVARSNPLTVRDLQFQPASGAKEESAALSRARLTLREMEQIHIAEVLQEEFGSVEKAARRLGVPRSSLYNKLRRLGLSRANPGGRSS